MIISIQLLRYLAAAFVVFAHVLAEYEGLTLIGTFGVDIFFVISGFIISFITEENTNNFLANRFIRIMPLYWLFTLTIGIISYFYPSLLRSASFDVSHLTCSLLFVPCWNEATKFNPILGLGWTLNYEMYFYLIFYISMVISHKYRELIASGLLIVIALAIALMPLDYTNPINYYSNDIVFEFIAGMAIAIAYRRKPGLFNYKSWIVLLLTSVLVVGLLVYTEKYYFHYISSNNLRFVVWGSLSAALFWIFISMENTFKSKLAFAKPYILAAGNLSYPLYLIHIYIIATVTRIFSPNELSVFVLFCAMLLISSFAAFLATKLFDEPVRKILVSKLKRF